MKSSRVAFCTFFYLGRNVGTVRGKAMGVIYTRRNSLKNASFSNIIPYQLYSTAADFSSPSRDKCWKCSKTLTSSSKYFCEHCATILPPADIDFFDILSVNKSFEVSSEALQMSFKQSQRLLHPDKFTLKTEKERELSEEVSSLINTAYFTLLNPLRRGIYMLEQEGIHIEENTQMDDPEFLMEVMGLNEEIAEAEGRDSLLMKIQSHIKDDCSKLINDLADAFRDERLEDAKKLLIKLRYFNNMQEKLRHMITPT